MAILFKHKRLHVGYRQRDWSDVWFEPLGSEDADGAATIGLFKLTTGEADRREPMEGEVLWHPEFDKKNCESQSPRERDKIQKEFLNDAWKYLAEEDPDEVQRMDEDLDQPDWSRWQKWFQHAQKYKRSQLKRREGRKRRRKTTTQGAGASNAETLEQTMSDNSSDSAYDSACEQRYRRRTASSAPDMPPPRRPEDRKANFNMPDARNTASTKRKPRNATSGSNSVRGSLPPMSGGLGKRITRRYAHSDSARHSPHLEPTRSIFVRDSDSENDIMDTTDPNLFPQRPLTASHEQWGFPSLKANLSSNASDTSITRVSLQNDDPARDERFQQHQREQSEAFPDEDMAFNEAVRRSEAPQDGNSNIVDLVNETLQQDQRVEEASGNAEDSAREQGLHAYEQPRMKEADDENKGIDDDENNE